MNMHGFIAPVQEGRRQRSPFFRPILDWLNGHRPLLLIVLLPTLLTAAYYYLVAADLYQTEAHYTIESSTPAKSNGGSGLGALLGIGGGLSPAEAQEVGLADYLNSQVAVNALRSKIDLVGMFRRPEADIFSRLRKANPSAEELLHYYRTRVKIRYDTDSSLSVLAVTAFTPGDSYKLARDLLLLGEQRVNELNQRSYSDAIAAARLQFAEADRQVKQTEQEITAYRQSHSDIDPATSGQAQTTLVTTMSGNLSAAKASLEQMSKTISTTSPQYLAMRDRVRSLQGQLDQQNGRLSGSGSTIASRLGGYENLNARQVFVQQQYAAASTNLQTAIEQARRQNLYLVRIVDPVQPTDSEYPERPRIIATVFFVLLVGYGIGWLIVAGVREHTM